MKTKDLQSLRTKDLKELTELVHHKGIEQVKSKAEIKAGREKNLKKVKFIKRDIAQILTIIKEKQIILKEQKELEDEKKIGKKSTKKV